MKTASKPATQPGKWLGCERPSFAQIAWLGALLVFVVGGTAAVKLLPLPAPLRYLIVALPFAAGLMYVLTAVSDLRRQLDELQLRIYLEATAVIVSGLFIFLVSFPLLKAADIVESIDSGALLVLMVLLGAVGFIGALRRYR